MNLSIITMWISEISEEQLAKLDKTTQEKVNELFILLLLSFAMQALNEEIHVCVYRMKKFSTKNESAEGLRSYPMERVTKS